jgi:hypothetical protein
MPDLIPDNHAVGVRADPCHGQEDELFEFAEGSFEAHFLLVTEKMGVSLGFT